MTWPGAIARAASAAFSATSGCALHPAKAIGAGCRNAHCRRRTRVDLRVVGLRASARRCARQPCRQCVHIRREAMDVVVPARLLNQLGMTHRVIEYPPLDNAEFREVFRHNNATANDVYCRDSQALHEHLEDGRVCVTGDAAEIFKCYYQAHQTDEISPKLLAKLSRLGMHPFVVNAFASWLVTARGLPIDTLDLFCWEQMAGRWQAKVRAEYDIVQESFSPLNQRALLVDILGVDRALRQGPGFFFLQRLIERLWPEVLAEPINPPEARSLPRRIASSLKRSALRAISWVSVDTGMNLSAGGWPPCHAAPRDDFKL